jgi:hypothetical protein
LNLLRFSIDEFRQLLNVLSIAMSFHSVVSAEQAYSNRFSRLDQLRIDLWRPINSVRCQVIASSLSSILSSRTLADLWSF